MKNQLDDNLFNVDQNSSGLLVLTLLNRDEKIQEPAPFMQNSNSPMTYANVFPIEQSDTLHHRISTNMPVSNINAIAVQTAGLASTDNTEMSEVVVTALAVKREKKEIGHSTESVSGEIGLSRRQQKNYQRNLLLQTNAQNDMENSGKAVMPMTQAIRFSGEQYVQNISISNQLINDDKEKWLTWRKQMENQFIASQNPNGSWTGYHCFSSPAICTASVLLAWYADN